LFGLISRDGEDGAGIGEVVGDCVCADWTVDTGGRILGIFAGKEVGRVLTNPFLEEYVEIFVVAVVVAAEVVVDIAFVVAVHIVVAIGFGKHVVMPFVVLKLDLACKMALLYYNNNLVVHCSQPFVEQEEMLGYLSL